MRFTKIVFWLPLFLIFFVSCGNESEENIEAEGIQIIIPDSSFQKIVKIRNKFVHKKNFTERFYVDAKIKTPSKTFKAKVRLKGDHTDHLKGARWSYRVKLKNGKLFGEDKFSIQGVHTRGFITEWIFHELLEQEGLMRLQYKFIPVEINNIDSLSGIYVFESHFKTDILKIHGFEPGPILKFNEDEFWDWSNTAGKFGDRDSLIRTISKIEITNKKGFAKKDGKIAKQKLRDYVDLKVSAEEIFDMEKWAKFIAINAFFAGDHALRFHNLRFYYNLRTQLFEPIGFDLCSWHKKRGGWHLSKDSMESFYESFYDSEKFKEALLSETKKLCEPAFLDQFIQQRKKRIKQVMAKIREEKPKYWFPENKLRKNQAAIKAAIKGKE